ncbi:MAG: hypothetical protein U0744_01580 [Gemmataceae bacterium]
MDDITRRESNRIPYWICACHGIGILATTVIGLVILRSGAFVCAGLGGLWLLVPHLFGVFHAWSFPRCRPASWTLLGAAVPMALLTLLVAIIAWPELSQPRHHHLGRRFAVLEGVVVGTMVLPLILHTLELAAFLKARRIANTPAFGRRLLEDDDLSIDLRRDSEA